MPFSTWVTSLAFQKVVGAGKLGGVDSVGQAVQTVAGPVGCGCSVLTGVVQAQVHLADVSVGELAEFEVNDYEAA